MASSTTNKTIWTLAICGVLIFLAVKLWPSLRKLLNSAAGGSGGGGGGTTAGYAGNPYYPQVTPGGGGIQAGVGIGNNPGGTGLTSALQSLSNLLFAGTYAGSTYAQQDYIDQQADVGGEDLNATGLPLETTSNFDFGTSGYSANDPNAPWNSGGTDAGEYDQLFDIGGSSGGDSVSVVQGEGTTDPGSYGGDSGGNGGVQNADYAY